MDIAEIIGFLQSDEMNMPMDKSAHPNKKKPKTVLMQVINEIFPKMHSTKGIVNIVTQEKKRTVTVSYIEGYKSRVGNIPFEDMVAAYDKNGEIMKFGAIKGPSVLLTNDELEKDNIKEREI